MMPFNPRLNGTPIKEPSELQIQEFKLTKSGRVASGKMTMDIIAKKRKFFFTYNVLSGPELDAIMAIVQDGPAFFTLQYNQNGVEKSATVYAGAPKMTKFRTDGKWYWKNVQFDLIEQ